MVRRLPLEGVRVTDFGWIINGPQTTLWLAALGAEVIKVESRVYPDTMRNVPAGGPADGVTGLERNATYNWLNYSKKSVSLNLGTSEGVELAHRLIAKSDIVVEAFKGPDVEKFKLTWADVHETNPAAVLLSISLLGRTGPTRDWVGWGPMALGIIGFSHASGHRTGRPNRQVGGTWPDYSVANVLGFLALSALRQARKTGEGQWIDAGMSDAVAGTIPEWYIEYAMNGRDLGRVGNEHLAMAPHGTYPCEGDDRWIAITVEDDAQWEGLLEVLGRPDWGSDPRFRDQYGRWSHRDDLDGLLAQATRALDSEKLFHRLQAAGVPAGPVLKLSDWVQDPHLAARGYFWQMDHPEIGRRTMPGIPAAFSEAGPFRYEPPPLLGQHTREVLHDLLGVSEPELDRMEREKVLY
jgi:benzylsuccinate CoA-transferase BbsF subunit